MSTTTILELLAGASRAPALCDAHGLTRRLALALVALAVTLGIGFRFTSLGTRSYWYDEAFTSLRVSGHSQRELGRLEDGREHRIGVLFRFQRVDRTKTVRDTANALAVDEPQHTPLFFVAARAWAGMFGDSPQALRAFAGLMSVLAMLGVFLLCGELFPGSIARWVCLGLLAVSPFQLVYAHQAREYSLWAALTLLAGAALIRALRDEGTRSWLVYASLVALGLYADLLFVLVMLSHAAFVLAGAVTRRGRALFGYLAASALGIVAFSPWIATFFQHRDVVQSDMDWGMHSLPPLLFVQKWIFNTGAVFFDLEFRWLAFAPVALAVLLLAALATLVAFRTMSTAARRFVWLLLLVTAVALVGRDLVASTMYSTGARYLVPTWLALEIAVGYAIAWCLGREDVRVRRAGALSLVAFLVCGAASCAVGIRQSIWWDNHGDQRTPAIAASVNDALAPFIVTEHEHFGNLLVLSRYLRPDATFLVTAPGTIAASSICRARTFFLSPDREMYDAALRACPGRRLREVDLASARQMGASPADRFHSAVLEAGRNAKRRISGPDTLWRLLPGG